MRARFNIQSLFLYWRKNMILLISLIFLLCGIFLFYKATQIKIHKNKQKEQYNELLKNELHNLQKERNNLINSEIQKKEKLNKDLLQFQEYRTKELNDSLQKEKQLIKLKLQKVNNETQQQIEHIHKDLNKIRESALKEKEKIQNQLDELQSSLNAGIEARLREQEKKDNIKFYKLSINETDLADVKILENLKPSLHKPVILSKLIWTQYFQKQMTELCNRVLGKKTICGIYKITNLLTEQRYIGQSVDIAKRWKDHCKCGLGIDASTTNLLYNSMQKDGVWNFSFELIEECPRKDLNNKERFWIQMYQSNKFGYNTMKGNK